MLPTYVLIVDVISRDRTIDQAQFHALVDPCQAYLDCLQGAFDRKLSTKDFYPPDLQNEESEKEFWSFRGIVMISVGIERGQNLIQLYQAIANLIALELPSFDVSAEIKKLEFS